MTACGRQHYPLQLVLGIDVLCSHVLILTIGMWLIFVADHLHWRFSNYPISPLKEDTYIETLQVLIWSIMGLIYHCPTLLAKTTATPLRIGYLRILHDLQMSCSDFIQHGVDSSPTNYHQLCSQWWHGSCQNDSLLCHKWRQCCHSDDSMLTVFAL